MNKLDGALFKKLLASAKNNLTNSQKEVDAMNVFPVPDGDTGTNMTMTFSNGYNEAIKVTSPNVCDIAKGLSYGLLMGARGNSGVITSQIFRGFYLATENKKELTVEDINKCFLKGSEIAYKAVMRPVEGTILTVIRLASENTSKYLDLNPLISMEEYFDVLFAEAKLALDKTPDLMPLLKEVGVVDSGGFGLLKILEGFKLAINNQPVELTNSDLEITQVQANIESDEYGYCTEFVLRLSNSGRIIFDEDKLKRALLRIGNSLVVVCDEDLVKVHVHTLIPGEVLSIAGRFGDFVKIKIENMSIQHENIIVNSKVSEKEYGILAVCSGKGLEDYFKELRCDKIISGGQTMNPSTDDFVKSIKELNAKHIYVLPNNSNIIMAAKQAMDVLDDLDITVFETKSIQQGISALLNFNPEVDNETNIELMKIGIENVDYGSITYAIKDTKINDIEIKKGDYLAMHNKDIVVSDSKLDFACISLIEDMYFDSCELLTIYTGLEADENITERLVNYVEKKYNIETEVIKGDQPVYNYLFGIE